MQSKIFETIIGFLVIAVAGWFIAHIYMVRGESPLTSVYSVKANFENVQGISKGSEVVLAGVKVGEVIGVELEQEEYIATLTLGINKQYLLPKDSRAAIWSKSLIGGKHVVLTPGSLEENLENNEYIKYTQSSVNLESLIGKLIYSIDKD